MDPNTAQVIETAIGCGSALVAVLAITYALYWDSRYRG